MSLSYFVARERQHLHMFLVECQHLLWTGFSAGTLQIPSQLCTLQGGSRYQKSTYQTCLASIKAAVVVLFIPDEVCPKLAVVVLLNGINIHHQWIPSVVIWGRRLPGIWIDIRVSNRWLRRGVWLWHGQALATPLLLFGGFDLRAGGLSPTFLLLVCWFWLPPDLGPVSLEDLAGTPRYRGRV